MDIGFNWKELFPAGIMASGTVAVGRAVEILRFEPGAEAGVVDFRLALPEVGLEAALDAEMPELELDVLRAFWEVAADVIRSDVQPSNAVTFALCFDNHLEPAFDIG